MSYFDSAKCKVNINGYRIEYTVDEFSKRDLRLHSVDIQKDKVRISLYRRNGGKRYTAVVNGHSVGIKSVPALLNKFIKNNDVVGYISNMFDDVVRDYTTVDDCVAHVASLAKEYNARVI